VQAQAILYMLIGSAFIGLGPFFVEFSAVSAETNTFYRLLVGSIFFTTYSCFKKEVKIDRMFLIISTLAGGLLFLDLFLWNQSILYVGAGLSTVLSNIEIVFLVFIGKVFFAETVPAKFSFLFGFIIIGICALLVPILPQINLQSAFGIIISLCASLSYALYLFSIKYISKKFPKQTTTGMLSVVCLTGCAVIGIFILSRDVKLFFLPSWHSVICVFANSILSQVIGWWFISKGIAQLSLSLSGLLLLLQPALTFFLDCLYLKRNTHWLQFIGCFCLLTSVYVAAQNKQLQKESNESCHTNSG